MNHAHVRGIVEVIQWNIELMEGLQHGEKFGVELMRLGQKLNQTILKFLTWYDELDPAEQEMASKGMVTVPTDPKAIQATIAYLDKMMELEDDRTEAQTP